jgi:hypothetical protein
LVTATVATAIAAASAATTTTATAKGAALSATAATATRAVFAGTRFIHGQRTALHGLAVKDADRLLRFLGGRHGDEGKSAGTARELVLHERDFGNGAGFGEGVLKIDFGGIEGKISDVEFIRHIAVVVCVSSTALVAVSGYRI